MTDAEIGACNLMSTAAHALANAVRTGAYADVEAFLAGFSTALAGRLELIDKQQNPTVHAWLSTMQNRIERPMKRANKGWATSPSRAYGPRRSPFGPSEARIAPIVTR